MIKSEGIKRNSDTSTLSKVKDFIKEYRRIANSSHAGTNKIKVSFDEQLETAISVVFKNPLIPAYNPYLSTRRPTTRRQSSDKRNFGYQLPQAKTDQETMLDTTSREVKRASGPIYYRKNRAPRVKSKTLYFDIVK